MNRVFPLDERLTHPSESRDKALFAKRLRYAIVVPAISGSLTGILVALAEMIPWSLSTMLISLFFLIWLVSTLAFSGFAAATLLRRANSWGFLLLLLGLAGTVTALFNSMSLYLAQLFSGNTYITWNVDYRYHLMHSRSLIQAQGPDSLLIASDIPISYHVGPAWVAASLDTTLHIPVDFVSFALVPAVSLISIVTAMGMLLVRLGIAKSVAVGSIGITLALPFLHRGITHLTAVAYQEETLLGALFTDHTAWYFSPSLMLNTFFGLGILGASLSLLLLKPRFAVAIVSGLAFGSIMATKPQVAILAPVILILIGLSMRFGLGFIRRPFLVGLTTSGVIASVTILASLTLRRNAVGVTDLQLLLTQSWSGDMLLFYLLGPGGFVILLAIAVGIFRLLNYRRFAGPALGLPASIFSLGLGATIFAMVLGFSFVQFDSPTVDRSSEMFTSDFMQGVPFMALLCVALIFAQTLSGHFGLERILRVLLFSFAAIGLLLQSTQSIKTIQNPERGYEFVDSSAVAEALRGVFSDHLLVVSDWADPAQDFLRPGDANYIPGETGAQFWIGGFRYELARNEEAQRRARLAEKFFTTNWSAWHMDFLKETGVTHALISPRCQPVWFQPDDGKEDSGVLSADWVLLSLNDMKSIGVGGPEWNNEFNPLEPAYGVSGCLSSE